MAFMVSISYCSSSTSTSLIPASFLSAALMLMEIRFDLIVVLLACLLACYLLTSLFIHLFIYLFLPY